jgi:hypothetical protein
MKASGLRNPPEASEMGNGLRVSTPCKDRLSDVVSMVPSDRVATRESTQRQETVKNSIGTRQVIPLLAGNCGGESNTRLRP